MLEYIAYEGEKFTIEWYFTENKNCPALDYFEGLSNDRKRSVFQLFQLMGDLGEIRNKTKFRNEGDKIYAFKPQPDRFLCFFMKGKKIIVTNAFEKKSQKLPKKEKDKALKLKKDYQSRLNEGIYYE